MDLSIIIVSYNTADLIGMCLSSVTAPDDLVKEVFVVDNASSDESVNYVQKNFPFVHLIVNPENRGFGAANNQVLSLCTGRYVFFLNPDTQILPGAFKKAILFMDASPHIGLAGTKLIYPDNTLHESVSYRYPGQKYTSGEMIEFRGSIACVQGSSMIAHADIIKEVGGFDEDFFLYGEDEDLCFRIRKLGYEIGYIEEAVVIHLGGQSERQSTSAEKWAKKVRAEYLFYRKHYLPDTVKRIRRADLLKAHWRIAMLRLTMPLLKDKTKAHEKLIRYQIINRELRRGVL
ncbi:MAG TPA: glycosyltransferase family 2 protein [Syntrophales bacterium]|nr:glycosyltransferase family 2 protein [Syntrophales bacterium]